MFAKRSSLSTAKEKKAASFMKSLCRMNRFWGVFVIVCGGVFHGINGEYKKYLELTYCMHIS